MTEGDSRLPAKPSKGTAMSDLKMVRDALQELGLVDIPGFEESAEQALVAFDRIEAEVERLEDEVNRLEDENERLRKATEKQQFLRLRYGGVRAEVLEGGNDE
jgi:hypothetical protein